MNFISIRTPLHWGLACVARRKGVTAFEELIAFAMRGYFG